MRKLVKKLLVKGWWFEKVTKKQGTISEEDLCECCKSRKKGEGLRKLCPSCFEKGEEVAWEHQIKIE